MKYKVKKKLSATRKKVSKGWKHYRRNKKKILFSKRIPADFKAAIIDELRDVTKINISTYYEDYRGFKYGLLHRSPFEDFSFNKKIIGNYRTNKDTGKKEYFKFENSYHEIYKAKKGYDENDLNSQVKDILNKENVRGLLVTIKILDEDSGVITYLSSFINKPLLTKLDEKGDSIYDDLVYKAKQNKSMQEFKLKDIYIRIIYEKPHKD